MFNLGSLVYLYSLEVCLHCVHYKRPRLTRPLNCGQRTPQRGPPEAILVAFERKQNKMKKKKKKHQSLDGNDKLRNTRADFSTADMSRA